MPRTQERFNGLVLKLGVKPATITRVVPERGFGFLRGSGEDFDTFFHANVVRFTEAEIKKLKSARAEAKAAGQPVETKDAFTVLEVGARVLYLPFLNDRDGKGPRARWVGVGDPGGLK